MRKINGFDLPMPLQRLIALGRWRLPDDTARVARITGNDMDPQHLDCLSLPEMEQQINSFRRLPADLLSTYGFCSSIDESTGLCVLPRLDLTLSVPLMVGHSEFFVALDYRSTPPCIVACDPSDMSRFVTISPDFATFATEMGF